MRDEPEDLDLAIRDTVSDGLGPGDAVVSWLTIAGIRNIDGGGYVITLCSGDVPPLWQIRGMLSEAESGITRGQIVSELEDTYEE